jgi:hypothetical protein
MKLPRPILASALVHVLIVVLLVTFLHLPHSIPKNPLTVEVIGEVPSGKHSASKVGSRSASGLGKLRLSLFSKSTTRVVEGDLSAEGQRFTQDVLTSESKVWELFDTLAARINHHLDYLQMMIDNGIHGTAVLDLYFDSQGNVDETRSKTQGDNSFVRGMLVRSTRKGLVDWFAKDASRLRKDQFRNQHFRADFILSYSQESESKLIKSGPGSYGFLRKYFSNPECIGAGGGGIGIDLFCVASEVAGAIHHTLSDKYKIEVIAMKDSLEYYDRLDLDGINALIHPEG